MLFSDRTPDDLSPNAISRAIEAHSSKPLLDLTESNPTQCGFEYPASLFLGLSGVQVSLYGPESFGTLGARQAVARYLVSRGQVVKPENLLLTASTSEAYSYLFKLLGNPGDSFLVPTPGYPLLDHLTRLEAVELLPYHLQMSEGWPVDMKSAQQAAGSNTKGLVVVNPHNPTGCFVSPQDQRELLDLCEARSIAYISDEVFTDYAYQEAPPTISNPNVLTFRMGGLSKSLGLPQLKLSWVAMNGPEKILRECRERLELIADTYLSVNTPVQSALGGLLAFAPNIQEQILSRVKANRVFLENHFKPESQIKIWPADGGWYVLVEVLKKGVDEEKLVIDLLEKQQVLVQPGGFYDLPGGCFLVVSLLPRRETFEKGIERIREQLKHQ